ncbi:MAG: hypothetical protein ACKO3N_19070 [Verrucomicrobiota bacterium]
MSEDVNRLEQLAQFIAGKIPALIGEATDQINAAIDAAVEAANEGEQEKEAVLSLPIAVKWNLDTNSVEIGIAVSVKRKFESVGQLPDPNQPELPMVDKGGHPLPRDPNTAVKRLARAIRLGEVTTEAGGAE